MIFVHIGMAKAGSSRLQHVLAANQGPLAERGVVYSETCRQGVAHHPLSRALSRPDGVNHPTWKTMREFLHTHRDRNVVISSEGFEAVDARYLREALDGFDARIICYVRETMTRLPSTYSQNTKYGLNVADFDTFFDKWNVALHRKWLYGKFLREWAVSFGAENIRVRSLDREILEQGDLVADFLSALGVRPGGFEDPASADNVGNESPGWKVLEAVRAIQGGALGSALTPREKIADVETWGYLRKSFEIALEVGVGLGWTERGRYLSAAQNEQLTELYDQQVDVIDSLGIDARVKRFDMDASLTREFLPEVGRIPSDELAAFFLSAGPRIIRKLLGTKGTQ